MEWYNGRICTPHDYRTGHVFDANGKYRICECGYTKRVSCSCAECDMSHTKTVETTLEERMGHELLKLDLRVQALEHAASPLSVAVERPSDQVS